MRAAVYHGPQDVRIEQVDDPAIEDPRDVVVETVTASMCGSDLYLYRGEVPDMVAPGRTTLGHEISARVVEVGPQVTRFAVGDRVTFPYSVSCGHCVACRQGQTAHCETTGKAIYGYGVAFGDLGGSQAEYVRVPHADGHLEHLPDEVDDEAAIFLSCNLPAAVIAVDAAAVSPGDRVAVIGCGPSGLLALDLLTHSPAGRVFALDPVAHRRDEAARRGAEPVTVDDDTVARILDETEGRGVDVVVEFAGRGPAFSLAAAITRPGGVISGGGVYLEQDHPTSLFDLFFKNLQLRLNGFANAAMGFPRALEALRSGVVDPTTVVTDRVSLDEFPEAARRFSERAEGALKMVIRP